MKMTTASAVSAALEKEHLEATEVKNIILHSNRKFRHRHVLAWYYSPYPEDFAGLERLYLHEMLVDDGQRCCRPYICSTVIVYSCEVDVDAFDDKNNDNAEI